MLSLIYYKNRDIRLENIPKPMPKEHELLIKVSDSGLCQTQINEFIEGPLILNVNDNSLTSKSLPLIVGHEFGGIIDEVGKNVSNNLIGKQVAVLPLLSCGVCEWCEKDENQLCDSYAYYGLTGEHGGFCEYSVVNENNIFILEEKSMITFLEPMLVAVHLARKVKDVNKDVLILGAGGLGIACAVILKELFNANVCISEILPQRTKRAKDAGFNMIDKNDIKDNSYDVVIDCAGTNSDSSIPSAFTESFKYLNKNATLVMVGVYFHEISISVVPIIVQEQIIMGTYGYNMNDVKWLKEKINNIKFDFSKMIDEIKLENIIEDGYYRGEVDKDSFSRLVVKC